MSKDNNKINKLDNNNLSNKEFKDFNNLGNNKIRQIQIHCLINLVVNKTIFLAIIIIMMFGIIRVGINNNKFNNNNSHNNHLMLLLIILDSFLVLIHLAQIHFNNGILNSINNQFNNNNNSNNSLIKISTHYLIILGI